MEKCWRNGRLSGTFNIDRLICQLLCLTILWNNKANIITIIIAYEVCVIDADGFRPNVGIILTDDQGRLLWARRVGGQDAWQFPQGGIKHNESPENALYRELDRKSVV